ncbi:MAG: M24 family metallopeptidase [Geminicoccaceae bacterium]
MMDQDLITHTSNAELERRWAAVRAAMKQHGLEALVMQGRDDWLGGYVRWFTDIWAVNAYPRTVIFYADRPMTIVEMGPFEGRREIADDDPIDRGVGKVFSTPSFFSIGYSPRYDAELAADELKTSGVKNIGLLTPDSLPVSLIRAIESIDGLTLSDATDMVDLIKAVKSPEELEQVSKACVMQDEVFAAVCGFIKPGMRDIDVINFAQAEAHRRGSDNGLFLGSSAPMGTSARFKSRQRQGGTINDGEHFSMLIEVNGPGGMYTEIARTMVLGRATNALKDAFATVKEAQDHTLSLIKPGADPAAIAKAHDEWMNGRGLPAERRLYAHGQGYDLVERPLIRADETMKLAANMNLAVHPGYDDGTVFAVICDNYLVTEDGVSDCLHQTPKQIFEID